MTIALCMFLIVLVIIAVWNMPLVALIPAGIIIASLIFVMIKAGADDLEDPLSWILNIFFWF